jgi:hypothetical protein
MMGFERLVHKVESDLYNLGKRLCSDEPAAERVEAVECLKAELQEAFDALSRCRTAATVTRRRIAANEIKAALLASQVETMVKTGNQEAAWDHVLELDQLHHDLAADRSELPYLEIACRNQQRRVARAERTLGDLQRRS